MMFKNLSNFQQRLAMSFLSVIVLAIAIYLSPFPYFRPLFLLLTASVIGAAVWEFYLIGKAKGYEPLDTLGIIGSIVYAISCYLSTQTSYAHFLPEIILGSILTLSFIYYFVTGKEPYINLAITLFGIAYLAVPLSCLISINYYFPPEFTQDGRWWLFYLLAVTKMTDTGAYFTGKLFGKHPLVPYISPKKTWEGSIGGSIVAILTSIFMPLIIQWFFHPTPLALPFWHSIWLGALISIVSQFGDLAESLLKRDGGLKDSNQLPGLGGILDIVDSLVFTAPLVYLYLKIQF